MRLIIKLIMISCCLFCFPLAHASSYKDSGRIMVEIYDTQPKTEQIKWIVRYVEKDIDDDGREVKKISYNFNSFKKEFLKMKFSKDTLIKINHVWDNPRRTASTTNISLNDRILNFIRKKGYEEASYFFFQNNNPKGLHIIYCTSSTPIKLRSFFVSYERLVSLSRMFNDIHDFQTHINLKFINKKANIYLTYWLNNPNTLVIANSIKKMLVSLGYTSIKIETAN